VDPLDPSAHRDLKDSRELGGRQENLVPTVHQANLDPEASLVFQARTATTATMVTPAHLEPWARPGPEACRACRAYRVPRGTAVTPALTVARVTLVYPEPKAPTASPDQEVPSALWAPAVLEESEDGKGRPDPPACGAWMASPDPLVPLGDPVNPAPQASRAPRVPRVTWVHRDPRDRSAFKDQEESPVDQDLPVNVVPLDPPARTA